MDLGIKGKRALVTGAGRGLGRAIARSLAAEGAHVGVVSRSEGDISSLISDLGGTPSGHRGFTMDLADKKAPGLLMNQIDQGFGSLDIVIHNLGGTLDIADPFCSLEDWRRVWRFNFEVALELNNIIIPGMRSRRWGRIVHIASISATENQGPVTYCTAKAALSAYSRSMGRVLAPDGIVMTAVLPGAVLAEGGYWDKTSHERPEHVRKYLKERMAIRRFGKPEEISNAVAFLCSDHASFFIGSVIPIDGGQGRSFFGQNEW